jgi:hypothetical protein
MARAMQRRHTAASTRDLSRPMRDRQACGRVAPILIASMAIHKRGRAANEICEKRRKALSYKALRLNKLLFEKSLARAAQPLYNGVYEAPYHYR